MTKKEGWINWLTKRIGTQRSRNLDSCEIEMKFAHAAEDDIYKNYPDKSHDWIFLRRPIFPLMYLLPPSRTLFSIRGWGANANNGQFLLDPAFEKCGNVQKEARPGENGDGDNLTKENFTKIESENAFALEIGENAKYIDEHKNDKLATICEEPEPKTQVSFDGFYQSQQTESLTTSIWDVPLLLSFTDDEDEQESYQDVFQDLGSLSPTCADAPKQVNCQVRIDRVKSPKPAKKTRSLIPVRTPIKAASKKLQRR